MKKNSLIKTAKKIIEDNIYLTIATSTIDGKPWISPLFFAYDENYNFYWISGKNSLHSQLISRNPNIAIVIFDSTAPVGKGDGVYFEAEAEELRKEQDIRLAIDLLNKRVTNDDFKIKSIDKLINNQGISSIYKGVPKKISKLTEGKLINGQYVDERVEITLR